MGKIALMFSGQGSQYHNMGKDLYQEFNSVKETFKVAETITKYPIKDIIFNQDDLRLNQTKYTQVCLFTFYQAILNLLKQYSIEADYSLGLSLGEYGAYLHNQVFTFEKGLEIVKKRAILMDEVSQLKPGKMTAIMNFNPQDIISYINNNHLLVNIANYNTPQQIVVSGQLDHVDKLKDILKDAGCKRMIDLKTSGAFHSSLMNQAELDFKDYLQDINLSPVKKHLYINLTGQEFKSDIKNVMAKQITHSVKFYQMIHALIDQGVDTFIEIGPKRSLCNFIKRIDPSIKTLNIEDKESLNKTLESLEVTYERIQ